MKISKKESAVVRNFTISDEFKKDFILSEYREASGNFFKGIDIGINYSRSFVLLNGILLSSIKWSGSLGDYEKQIIPDYIYLLVATVGIVLSILQFAIVPYYDRQLDNCGERCIEIEKIFGGQLYTKIVMTNRDSKRKITTTGTVKIVSILFLLIWIVIICYLSLRLLPF